MIYPEITLCLSWICQSFNDVSEWYIRASDVTGSHPSSPWGDVKWTCGRELVLHTGTEIHSFTGWSSNRIILHSPTRRKFILIRIIWSCFEMHTIGFIMLAGIVSMKLAQSFKHILFPFPELYSHFILLLIKVISLYDAIGVRQTCILKIFFKRKLEPISATYCC